MGIAWSTVVVFNGAKKRISATLELGRTTDRRIRMVCCSDSEAFATAMNRTGT
jgi:hypothetical protein